MNINNTSAFKPLFIGLAVMLVLAGCTMEKRVYMTGYNIEWFGKHNHNNKEKEQAQKPKEQSQIITMVEASVPNNAASTDTFLLASADNEGNFAPQERKSPPIHIVKATAEAKRMLFPSNIQLNSDTILLPTAQDNLHFKNSAIGGFIFSMLGLLLCFVVLPLFFFGLPGIILSAQGLKQAEKYKVKGKGFAIAGLVMGILDILLFLAALLILFFYVSRED